MRNRWLKGAFTVEMSAILPLLLFLVMQCIFLSFFFHDKSLLEGAAYEALVSMATNEKEPAEIDEGKILERFYERIHGKCILLSDVQGRVKEEGKELILEVEAKKFGWVIRIHRRWRILWPEEYIRKLPDILK